MWPKYVLSAAIVGLPGALLVARVVEDELFGYGWGWQMFS